MTGTTTGQLPLTTATDSDDTENFLTVSLTAVLQSLTNLFDSVTGHDHSGAGKGAPVVLGAASVGTAAIANGAVTNAKLAADVARANQLVNGGHDVWGRGTSAFTATAAYAADRWQITLAGTDTLSVIRNTANVDVGSVACSACTFVLGSGAGATRYSQVLKVSDGHQLAGRTISLSARRRTATANAVRVGILTDGTGGTTTFSGFHTGGGTFETLTATVTVPADATTITISTYFAASCTAYCDNDNLIVGSVAADYVPLHPADDLARCQRYYYRIAGQTVGTVVATGHVYATTDAMLPLPLFAKLAVTPTITVSAAGDWAVASATFVSQTCTALVGYTSSSDRMSLHATVAAGLVAGNATTFVTLNANSTVTAEANP